MTTTMRHNYKKLGVSANAGFVKEPYDSSGVMGRAFSPATFQPLSWYDVHSSTAGNTIPDRMGGAAATLGSTGGTDTNDPTWLPWAGVDYLYLPGVNFNDRADTPNSATLQTLVGNLDLRADTAQTLWSGQALPSVFIGKWGGGSQRSYFLRLNSDGKLELRWTADGNFPGIFSVSTVATGIPNGSRYQIRAILIANNGSGGNDVRFYIRDFALGLSLTDNSGWVQLGATVTTAGTTSVFVGTDPLWIGGYQDQLTHVAEGRIYRAIVMNDIGTTVLADFNASNFLSGSSTTYTDTIGTNGGIWTIKRNTAGRKAALIKGKGILLLGTDDYINVPTAAIPAMGLTDKFTVVAVFREWATPISFGRIWSTKTSGTGSATGIDFINEGTAFQWTAYIGDGTNAASISQAASTVSGINILSAVGFDGTSFTYYINNTSAVSVARGAVGNIVNTVANIGRIASGANYQDLEFMGFLTFQRQLSVAEISQLVNYYGAGV